MKRLLKSLVTLLLTVFPTACVYDYDPGVQGSQQTYLVVEGDILAGDYTLIQLSRMSALDAESTPEFITAANVFIQCENSGIFRVAELDYTTFDNPCFRIDTRDLDVNQRCQLVIILYGRYDHPNISYSTPWMQVQQTESVLDSLTYVVAPDYSQLDVRIHTHGKAEGYYRWIGKEIWEYSAVFRAIGYYDPTLDDIVLYENGEFFIGDEPGKIYELSYLECTCPKVKHGQRNHPQQCECSRQSILYILSQLEPDSQFDVRIENTILRGSDRCTFRITKNKGI